VGLADWGQLCECDMVGGILCKLGRGKARHGIQLDLALAGEEGDKGGRCSGISFRNERCEKLLPRVIEVEVRALECVSRCLLRKCRTAAAAR